MHPGNSLRPRSTGLEPLTAQTYDALGNNTGSPNGQTRLYDAEGRISTTSGSGTSASYWYDGEGHRVKQTVDGVTTLFAYDGLGRLAVEDGVPATPSGISYVTTDLLGSVRLVTNASGQVVSRHDYSPFGGELTNAARTSLGISYGAVDSSKLRFTSQQHDGATGLDYFGARYFSSQQGRFMSPDPVQAWRRNVAKPQRWNLYAYVSNNPLSFIDPNGEEEVFIFDQPTRPPDRGVRGMGYQGRVCVVRNEGAVAGPFRGGSYPGSADYSPGKGFTPYTGNQVDGGDHKFNNRSGHHRVQQKGLNLVDSTGDRSPGTDPSGAPVTMQSVNAHQGLSDLAKPTSRGSQGCLTVCPGDPGQFFQNFDWSTGGNTGKSEGSIHIFRDDSFETLGVELNLELNQREQRLEAAQQLMRNLRVSF